MRIAAFSGAEKLGEIMNGLEILLFAVCWSAFVVIGYTFISEIVNRILT